MVKLKFLLYTGGACTVCEKNAVYSGQIKSLIAKLTRLALSNHHRKRKKNSDEMLNCGPVTYTADTKKIEYLLLGNPTAAYILTSLVW